MEKGRRAGLFRVGRDFKPAGHVHKWTFQEREKMQEFEGLDYHEAVSKVYLHHLERKKPDWHWLAKWFLMGAVAVTVGIIAFVLKQSIDSLSKIKMAVAQQNFNIQDKSTWVASGLRLLTFDMVFILLSAMPVVFIIPQVYAHAMPMPMQMPVPMPMPMHTLMPMPLSPRPCQHPYPYPYPCTPPWCSQVLSKHTTKDKQSLGAHQELAAVAPSPE